MSYEVELGVQLEPAALDLPEGETRRTQLVVPDSTLVGESEQTEFENSLHPRQQQVSLCKFKRAFLLIISLDWRI